MDESLSFLLPPVVKAIEASLSEFPWHSKTKIRENLAKLEEAHHLLEQFMPESLKKDVRFRNILTLLQGVFSCLYGVPLMKLGMYEAALRQFSLAQEFFKEIDASTIESVGFKWWVELWSNYLAYYINHAKILKLLLRNESLELVQEQMSQLRFILKKLVDLLKKKHPVHAYYVKGLAYELNGTLALISAKMLLDRDPLEARRLIYECLRDFNRARFLQVEISEKDMHEYEALARTATINHWKEIIDQLWFEANNYAVDGQYERAADKFYEGYTLLINLDELALHSDPIVELNLRTFQTSYHECLAELALQAEDHHVAAQEFKKAASILHLYITEMRSPQTEDLLQPFELQKAYYEAMYLTSLGIIALDEGDDALAKQLFLQARDLFETILPQCRDLQLDPLVNSMNKAKDKIVTFLSLLEI